MTKRMAVNTPEAYEQQGNGLKEINLTKPLGVRPLVDLQAHHPRRNRRAYASGPCQRLRLGQ